MTTVTFEMTIDVTQMDQNTAAPNGRGELALYLDFDGVLHHENVLWHPKKGAYLSAPSKYSMFQHMQLLHELLAPYPEVNIILSTSWVRVYSYSRALERLSPQLRQRVVGATWHSEMSEQNFLLKSRGLQVWEDVARRRPRDWLALDDDADERLVDLVRRKQADEVPAQDRKHADVEQVAAPPHALARQQLARSRAPRVTARACVPSRGRCS